MGHKLLTLITGSLLCYATSVQAVKVMYRGFSTTTGDYTEFLTRGYDIQPNRPGVWYKGCRTDNYYCMAQLERCNIYEGARYRVPVHFAPPPDWSRFKEPEILKDHR